MSLPRGEKSSIRAVLQWMWDQSRSNTLAHLQSCAEQEVERIAKLVGEFCDRPRIRVAQRD